MKNAWVGIAALATLIGTPALAADMALKAPAPSAPPPCIWCGWYIGANAGGTWGDPNVTTSASAYQTMAVRAEFRPHLLRLRSLTHRCAPGTTHSLAAGRSAIITSLAAALLLVSRPTFKALAATALRALCTSFGTTVKPARLWKRQPRQLKSIIWARCVVALAFWDAELPCLWDGRLGIRTRGGICHQHPSLLRQPRPGWITSSHRYRQHFTN